MSTLKRVAIENIHPNEQRNFKLYPIDKVQVAALVESYETADDFGAITLRPIGAGQYEQAMGHHRVAAMKKAQLTHVNAVIDNYDDDEMLQIMIQENARQKGDNAPAMLDSLAAVTKVVAYYLLISDTLEDFVGLVDFKHGAPSLKTRSFEQAKTAIGAGDPVVFPFLKAYAGDGIAGATQVQALNKTLQASGELGRIYKGVSKRVNAELAEREAEEQEAEAARVKAEAKAKREAAAAKKAAEAARKAADKAKASAKVAARAAAAKAEKDAKNKARLRREEMVRNKELREQADKKRAQRHALDVKAAAAAKAAAEQAQGLNPEVLHMLKASRHQDMFRKYVTSDEGRRHITMAEQPSIVRDMLENTDGELTSGQIATDMQNLLASRNAGLRDALKAQREADETASVLNKVDNTIDAFSQVSGQVAKVLEKVAKLLDDPKCGDYTYSRIASSKKLSHAISEMEAHTASIRAAMNLRQNAITTHADDGLVSVQ